jgi:hypothetical protein
MQLEVEELDGSWGESKPEGQHAFKYQSPRLPSLYFLSMQMIAQLEFEELGIAGGRARLQTSVPAAVSPAIPIFPQMIAQLEFEELHIPLGGGAGLQTRISTAFPFVLPMIADDRAAGV